MFSYAELAIGGGMTKRNVQHLMESKEQFIPTGRGIRALKRVAGIGAFMGTGLPLFTSGRLAKAILDEFNQYDGEAPSGLSYLARDLSREAMKMLPQRANDTNDYHYHFALIRHPSVYSKGKALGSDVIIEIVDSRIVFINSRQFPKPDLVGWIDGLGRGSDARIIHVTEKLGAIDDEENHGWRAENERLQAEALVERENAVARTLTNISLAIRNALDRITEHRAGWRQPAGGIE
jgi:hypothetical protein